MSILEQFILEDKRAIVTGGAGGIGQATALVLAEAGAKVAIIDIKDASDTVDQIRAAGGQANYIQADLANEKEVDGAIVKARDELGRIDILHNNAGFAHSIPCEQMTYEQWRKVVSIDLDGCFLVARAVGRVMIADQIGGTIVNTASMSGIVVNYPQEQVAYNSAKAGVIQMTKSLACEWAKHNIRVNCVSPGYVATGMTNVEPELKEIWLQRLPIKRLARCEEIAAGVLYLVSHAAAYITGTNLVIDGGYSCH